MKKFLIIMLSFVGVLVISAVAVVAVLAEKEVSVQFEFDEPKSISIYNKNYKAVSVDDEEKIEDIVDALNDSMEISKLKLLSTKKKFETKVRVGDSPEYSVSLKERNICLQFEYDKEKTLVVYDGKDTKKISYKYLLIVLEDQNGILDHKIYYSTTTIFESKPIVVNFDEKQVKKII